MAEHKSVIDDLVKDFFRRLSAGKAPCRFISFSKVSFRHRSQPLKELFFKSGASTTI